MSSSISKVFTDLRAKKHMAFMPFITAGDPDVETTQAVIRKLDEAKVDLIEIGFPYSDPIADGPVIQASYTRSLNAKVHVSNIFGALKELKNEKLPPLIAMVSYAIIFRVGLEPFLQHCVNSGVSGLIIPDLPGNEACEVFEKVRAENLDLIQLVAPTTPRNRVKEILKCCSGFVYCIAVSGTTGERRDIQGELLDQLRWLREETELPLAVGFGISRPENVDPLRGLADGVIVGSAIVRKFQAIADQELSVEKGLEEIGNFAQEMSDAAHQTSSN